MTNFVQQASRSTDVPDLIPSTSAAGVDRNVNAFEFCRVIGKSDLGASPSLSVRITIYVSKLNHTG